MYLKKLLFSPLLLLTLLTACNTDDELKRQREDAFKAELQSLISLSQTLQQPDKLGTNDQFMAFVSAKSINNVLTGFNGLEVELPNTGGAKLKVNSVNASFRTGPPIIEAEATVERSGIKAAAQLAARLVAEIDAEKSDHLTLTVHIDSLVPRIEWGFWNIKIRGFARDVMQSKLSELANGPNVLGKISIPMTQQFSAVLPVKTVSTTIPGANVSVSTPALTLNFSIKVEHILFLKDGLHVFAKALL